MGYYESKDGVSHRMPDEYSKDWSNTPSPGEWWEWWHLGYEDGYSKAEREYTNQELKKLRQENEALRNLLSANIRVIKEELRKELSADTNINY